MARFLRSVQTYHKSMCHGYSTISVTVNSGLRVITLQRPEKFNAFNNEMYNEVLEDLSKAADDENTVVTALTGAGEYFSSGNDLTAFSQVPSNLEQRKEFSKIKGQRLIKGQLLNFMIKSKDVSDAQTSKRLNDHSIEKKSKV